MPRLSLPVGFTLTVVLLSLCPNLANAAELSGSRPNIILMMTDDQGYGPVGRHGHPWIETPNLDTLHDTSLRFDRFLVSPTCSPTRSALMTGRHPLKNGVTHTILERERMTLNAVTLPQVLKEVGYTTGIFGKWHLGDEEPYQPHRRGFDEAFIHGAGGIGQAYSCSCADAPGNRYFNPVLRHNGKFVKTEGYCTNLFFTAARGWIQKVKENDKPFFAYISTNAPHGPFIAPEENTRKFRSFGFDAKSAGFYGMIENIDENVGKLLTNLADWGLMENTVVIFMSDNGTTGAGAGRPGRRLGEIKNREAFPYNAGMKGYKGSADEGGVRVPFFVRWDGKIKVRKRIDTVTAHIDLFPTVADLAGAKLPAGQVEGRSLLPLIENPESAWEDRYLFTQKARWKTGSEPNDHQWKSFAVRNQRYRLVGDELFDMEQDPGQKIDVSGKHPEVVKAMREAYDKFWKEARPLMVNEEAPMSPTRPYHVLFKKQSENGGIPAWKPPVLP